MSLTETVDASLAEALTQILREASLPLTLTQLLKARPEGTSQEAVRAELVGLHRQGRIFLAPGGRGKRYWGHDAAQRAAEVLRTELQDDPKTLNELQQTLGKKLKGVGSKKWRSEQVKAFAKFPDVYRLPKCGRKGERLSLQQASADEYITKAVVEPLETLTRKLKGAGVRPADVILAAARRMGVLLPVEAGGKPGAVAREELRELLIKGMSDLDAQVEVGALVSLRELRRLMPPEYQTRETFDWAVLDLAEGGLYTLQRHNSPDLLPPTEREELVQDGRGTYYVGIGRRV